MSQIENGSSADLEPRRMPSSPLELLFDEAGATLGRVERELRQGFAALADRHEARMAQVELVAMKAEQERERLWRDKQAQLGSDMPMSGDVIDEVMGQITPMMDEMRQSMVDVQERMAGCEARIAECESMMMDQQRGIEAPEFFQSDILKAIASVEAQPANDKLPAFVLNLNPGEPKRKTITMRKDRNGNPFADVVEG